MSDIIRILHELEQQIGDLQRFSSQAVPTGSYFQYGAVTAPPGYLLCSGGTVSRETYADLFAVIGTSFGAGDSSTTFNLPNLAGWIIKT